MYFANVKRYAVTLFAVSIMLIFIRPSYTETTHALIILMDNDVNIAPSVEKDSETIQKSLEILQKEQICDLEMTVMLASDGKIRSSDIFQWLDDAYPFEQDTVMVYYSGHGFIDEQNRHHLIFDENDIVPRARIIEELEKTDCRLRMLITDSCSNLVELPMPITAMARSLG